MLLVGSERGQTRRRAAATIDSRLTWHDLDQLAITQVACAHGSMGRMGSRPSHY